MPGCNCLNQHLSAGTRTGQTHITKNTHHLSTRFRTGLSELCPCQTGRMTTELCPCQTSSMTTELCPCQTSSMTTEFCPSDTQTYCSRLSSALVLLGFVLSGYQLACWDELSSALLLGLSLLLVIRSPLFKLLGAR